MKQMLSFLLAAVLFLSVFAGCANGTPGNTESETAGLGQSGDAETSGNEYNFDSIAVTYVKSPLNVPSIVEKEYGFFADAFSPYGLDVTYYNLTTGPEQTQALASGDIQFLYAVGATSVILSASNGADIKIISTYSRSPEAFRLFAANDSISSAADLAGKKVAGPKGTILHELLIAYLATAGLTESDIEFFAMDIPSSQAALVAGEVDCALLAGPAAYNMAKDGFAIVTTGEGLVDATIVTATSQSFYEQYPELVAAFVDAQKTTLAYMDENYDRVMEITAVETELDVDAVIEMYPMYDFAIEITPGDIDSMARTEAFMHENDMIENPVDINSLILTME